VIPHGVLLLCVLVFAYPVSVIDAGARSIVDAVEMYICAREAPRAGDQPDLVAERYFEVKRVLRFTDGTLIRSTPVLRLPWGADKP